MAISVLVANICAVESVIDSYDLTVGTDHRDNAVIDIVASVIVASVAVVTAVATNPAAVAPANDRSAPVTGFGVGGSTLVGTVVEDGLGALLGAYNTAWLGAYKTALLGAYIPAGLGAYNPALLGARRARAEVTDARARPNIATDRS
jgi:hypothetical protein